jgi:ABC-type lipoprotein release transport system permease subunit
LRGRRTASGLTFELRLQSRIAGDRHVSVHESLMERLGAAGRALAEHLYRTAWYDPVTYVGVTAGLLAVAVLASWLPAFRAASASPVRLLR